MSDQDTAPFSAPEATTTANGTAPAVEPEPAAEPASAPDLAREVKLTWRAVEQLDMRVQTIQIELAVLVGVMLLLTVIEIRRGRGGGAE